MEQKLSFLTELIKMIRADGLEKPIEIQFVHGLGEMLGVENSVVEELFDEYTDFVSPKNEIDRILQFQRLILMANVDRAVSASEINILKRNGLFLGLHPEGVERALLEMRKHPNGVIPVPQFIQLFQIHHN